MSWSRPYHGRVLIDLITCVVLIVLSMVFMATAGPSRHGRWQTARPFVLWGAVALTLGLRANPSLVLLLLGLTLSAFTPWRRRG